LALDLRPEQISKFCAVRPTAFDKVPYQLGGLLPGHLAGFHEVSHDRLGAVQRQLGNPRGEQRQPSDFVDQGSSLPDLASSMRVQNGLTVIPISDANPTRRFPVVTIALIVVNVVAYFLVQPGSPTIGGESPADFRFFVENAPVPCQLENVCPPEVLGVPIPTRTFFEFLGSVLFSAFLHANLLHLGGNMLFLWIFGNNVEDYFGPIKYLLFYLAGGLAAGFAQVFTNLGTDVPSIGASGAVAAVLGSYFLLYPRARVNTLVFIFFFITIVQLSAFAVLGLWFLFQIFVPQPGVAWQAHAGGFIFGLVLTFLLGGRPHRQKPVWAQEWRY
jgi:membrane associated rhomboid family serine protease